LRELVRRPPCTERLTATDSAPPPRESAIGRSRYGPSAIVTPHHQFYCEACFMVSDHVCIRTILYARVLIHGAKDVTSPPGFLYRNRKEPPAIPGPYKIPQVHTVQSPSSIAPHALWSKLPASLRLHRPTTTPTAERIPDPPIQR
jgi:hypothetical protein